MKRQTLYFFRLPPKPGKRAGRITTWRMSEEEAAAGYPGAERIDFDSITVNVGETPEEIAKLHRTHGETTPVPWWKAGQATTVTPPAQPPGTPDTDPPPRSA